MTGTPGVIVFLGSAAAALWVYQDVKSMGRRTELWAAGAFLYFPLGPIAYLVVRKSEEAPDPGIAVRIAALPGIAVCGVLWVLIQMAVLIRPFGWFDGNTWHTIGNATFGFMLLGYAIGMRAQLHPLVGLLAYSLGAAVGAIIMIAGGFTVQSTMPRVAWGLALAIGVAVAAVSWDRFAMVGGRIAGIAQVAVPVLVAVAFLMVTMGTVQALTPRDPGRVTYVVTNLGPTPVDITTWKGATPVTVACGESRTVPGAADQRPSLPWRLSITMTGSSWQVWDWQINDASAPFEIRDAGVAPATQVLIAPDSHPALMSLVPKPNCGTAKAA